MDYLKLWEEIQASPACAPHVITNDMPKMPGSEVIVHDAAIADILNAGRVRVVPHMITERGVMEALGPTGGDAFLSTLEAIQYTGDLPAPLAPYLGAIRRGVAWLKTDGLDVGAGTTRALLDALAAAGLLNAASVATIKALAEQPDHIAAADASRAVRGPRE